VKWPKLKRDYKGLRVRLLRDVQTRGGTTFPAGTIMQVQQYWRGLDLIYTEACESCKLTHRTTINRVDQCDVELVSTGGDDVEE